MSILLRSAIILAALNLGIPRVTQAQEDNHVALGVNFTARAADSSGTHIGNGVGLAWRFGDSDTGWGWTGGLGWFAADVEQSIGGATAHVGELHVRPFMAGYGYTYAINRRATVSTELLGGYAFVSFHQTPAAADAYRDRLGARAVDIHASNTFVVRPQSNLWIDVAAKFGVNVTVAYAIARPTITTRSSLGEQRHRLHADAVAISAGVVYKIF